MTKQFEPETKVCLTGKDDFLMVHRYATGKVLRQDFRRGDFDTEVRWDDGPPYLTWVPSLLLAVT